ncbi:MAG: hypothetical protein AB8B95_08970 [Pseudohongiellaceae bacterium]
MNKAYKTNDGAANAISRAAIRSENSPSSALILLLSALLLSCNPSVTSSSNFSEDSPAEEPIINRITVKHEEIRRDILSELETFEISYWINDDNSIGFPPADADTVDSIYYEVIGAYAARN